jgi:hypothetical protein
MAPWNPVLKVMDCKGSAFAGLELRSRSRGQSPWPCFLRSICWLGREERYPDFRRNRLFPFTKSALWLPGPEPDVAPDCYTQAAPPSTTRPLFGWGWGGIPALPGEAGDALRPDTTSTPPRATEVKRGPEPRGATHKRRSGGAEHGEHGEDRTLTAVSTVAWLGVAGEGRAIFLP